MVPRTRPDSRHTTQSLPDQYVAQVIPMVSLSLTLSVLVQLSARGEVQN